MVREKSKKVFKVVGIILAILMGCSVVLGAWYRINQRLVAAEEQKRDYKTVDYNTLDEKTYRTEESSAPAQITVFTHAFGGSALNWSNVINEKGEVEFAYQEHSMIEQLRVKLEKEGEEVIIMLAKVNAQRCLVEGTAVMENPLGIKEY